MDLSAKPYRIFLRVAELRSFSRAAEALNMSQPALSAHLREFERQLGFPLFLRTSRRVELSPQGVIFIDKARRIVLETEWVTNAAAEIRDNRLRIGVAHFSGGIALRTRLTDSFAIEHPDIPIAIAPRHPRQLIDDLALGAIDIAISLELMTSGHSSIVDPPSQAVERVIVGRRPVAIAIHSSHHWAGTQTLSTHDLVNKPIAILARAHGVALSEGIAHAVAACGASIVHPPEGDAVSVLRYAALTGISAIDLGWFTRPSTLGSFRVDWGLETSLVVSAKSGGQAIRAFLDHSRAKAARYAHSL